MIGVVLVMRRVRWLHGGMGQRRGSRHWLARGVTARVYSSVKCRDGKLAMEFQKAWPEAMTIGMLCQCQSALFDGVGELSWAGQGVTVGSLLGSTEPL